MAIIEYEVDKRDEKKRSKIKGRPTTFADKCLQAMLAGAAIAAIGYFIDLAPEPALLLKAIGLIVAFLGGVTLIIVGVWWLVKKILY